MAPAALSRWALVAAVEKHGRAQGGRHARLTLGDALLALPAFEARLPRGLRCARRLAAASASFFA
jgi:hypothetical protein